MKETKEIIIKVMAVISVEIIPESLLLIACCVLAVTLAVS